MKLVKVFSGHLTEYLMFDSCVVDRVEKLTH